jgi:DNA-binding response OmpR family regulator
LDGAKFLQILRRASKAGSTPVVIVTALDRDVAEDRIGDSAVAGIVVKREKLFEELRAKVRMVLGHGHQGEPAAMS